MEYILRPVFSEVSGTTATIGRNSFISSGDITITGFVPTCSDSFTGSGSRFAQ